MEMAAGFADGVGPQIRRDINFGLAGGQFTGETVMHCGAQSAGRQQ
jgi:hypothetical protein